MAPRPSNNSTTPRWPRAAAQPAAVSPSSATASIAAPASSRSSTTAVCPARGEEQRGPAALVEQRFGFVRGGFIDRHPRLQQRSHGFHVAFARRKHQRRAVVQPRPCRFVQQALPRRCLVLRLYDRRVIAHFLRNYTRTSSPMSRTTLLGSLAAKPLLNPRARFRPERAVRAVFVHRVTTQRREATLFEQRRAPRICSIASGLTSQSMPGIHQNVRSVQLIERVPMRPRARAPASSVFVPSRTSAMPPASTGKTSPKLLVAAVPESDDRARVARRAFRLRGELGRRGERDSPPHAATKAKSMMQSRTTLVWYKLPHVPTGGFSRNGRTLAPAMQ